MNPTLSLVLGVLETLATVAINPMLGLRGDGTRIARIISIVAALGREGDQGHDKLRELDEQVKTLNAANGPDPGPFWDAFEARHEAAFGRLQALKRE